MSDADTPTPPGPEQPLADETAPLPDPFVPAPPAEEPVLAAPATEFAPPPTEVPEASHPTEQFSTSQFPTTQFPATPQFPTTQFPAAEAPTAAMPTTPAMAPAPSSVVLGSSAPSAPKKKGVLAWALAGIAAIAAIAFAILWVGKSGDADDLTTERDQLVLEKSTLVKQLETATSDLESAQADLDNATADLGTANSDLEELQAEVDEKQAEVDDLTSQLVAAQNAPASGNKAVDYAPGLSLALGRALGSDADPALSDDEARCLGSNIIDSAGVDLVFIDYFEEIEPTEAEANRLGRAFILAADTCGIDFSRLNL